MSYFETPLDVSKGVDVYVGDGKWENFKLYGAVTNPLFKSAIYYEPIFSPIDGPDHKICRLELFFPAKDFHKSGIDLRVFKGIVIKGIKIITAPRGDIICNENEEIPMTIDRIGLDNLIDTLFVEDRLIISISSDYVRKNDEHAKMIKDDVDKKLLKGIKIQQYTND